MKMIVIKWQRCILKHKGLGIIKSEEINKMYKKFLAVALSAAMAIGVIGCSTGSSEVKTDNADVKLGEYKGLVVYHDDIEVSDEDYQAQVQQILSQHSTTEMVKEGKIKVGDTANVDYSGEIELDGKKVKFDGGTAEKQDITVTEDGQGYIEGFVAALVGHKVGDEFTEKLKFPKDYGSSTVEGKTVELAGKEVWFTFKVNGIQVTKTPELDDEFAKTYYGTYDVTDVKSFEKYLKKSMRADNIMNKVWNKFVESCEVVSYDKKEKESIIDQYVAQMADSVQQQYQQDIQSYLEAASMSEKEFREKIDEQYGVTESLKQKAIILALANKENLKPNAKDYSAEANKLAERMSMGAKELESTYGKDQIEYAVICQRVQDLIVDNVEVKEGSEPTTAPEETTAEEATTADDAKAEETKADK